MAADLAFLSDNFKINVRSQLVDSTIVQEGDSGIDFTVRTEPFPRRRFMVEWHTSEVEEVETFYEVNGRHTAFLIYAPRERDHKATNELLRNTATGLGQGDGTTATFQLQITRSTVTGVTIVRTASKDIVHPKSGTVSLTVDGIGQTEATDYTINYNTGIVTFLVGHIPAAGKDVRAVSMEFYLAMRFDSASLETQILIATADDEVDQVNQTSLIEALGQ